MRFTRTSFVGPLVISLALASGGLSHAAHERGEPAGTKSVTPEGKSRVHDHLDLLAGSSTELLYESTHSVADAGRDPLSLPVPSPRRELTARSKTGHLVDLGVAPADRAWSTAGRYVTGVQAAANGKPTAKVDVWDLSTEHHRVVGLPAKTLLVQATPHGFVFADGDSLKAWDAPTKAFTDLGVPVAGQAVSSLVTDDRELVATGASSGAVVMTYADPGTFTPLGTGPAVATCYALDHRGAACRLNLVPVSSGISFVPLDGAAATTTDSYAYDVAISGSEVMFTDDGSDETRLYGFSAANSDVTMSSGDVDFTVVSAYGKALFNSSDFSRPDRIFSAPSPADISPELRTPISPETAGGFALTASKIVYVSNLRDRSRPSQQAQLRGAPVHASAHHVSLGRSLQIAGTHGALQVRASRYPLHFRLVAATAHLVAYAVGDPAKPDQQWHVAVRTPKGLTILPHRISSFIGTVQAAGHLVLTTSAARRNAWVYDARSGHSRRVSFPHPLYSVALTPTHVAYASRNGIVHWRDLKSGRDRVVHHPHVRRSDVTVTASGSWVGWTVDPYVPRSTPTDTAVRDLAGHHPAIAMPHDVYGLNRDGVLMLHRPATGGGTKTWFRPFHGVTHRLLSPRDYDELPQLVGHALAWVSVDGNLKVAPYRF
jgi:hypothetical protein